MTLYFGQVALYSEINHIISYYNIHFNKFDRSLSRRMDCVQRTLKWRRRRRHMRWSFGHMVRQMGFLRVLQFPPTRRPSERKHRCQGAWII